MSDEQKPPTWAIYTNTPISDAEAIQLYRALAQGGLAIVPGNARIERISPPTVFVVTHDDGVVHESELEILAIFGTQTEAETWLDAEHPDWCKPYSDYAIDHWELGPPKKERDA